MDIFSEKKEGLKLGLGLTIHGSPCIEKRATLRMKHKNWAMNLLDLRSFRTALLEILECEWTWI